MDKYLVATKKDFFDVNFATIGAKVDFWTNRDYFYNNMDKGDAVYIRVQGSNCVRAICKVINVVTTSGGTHKFSIKMEVLKHVVISTKEIFDDYGIKAGAEYAKMKAHNG